MPVPAELQSFWSRAQAAVPGLDAARFYEAFAFGDSEPLAAELTELVLKGRKRATASLVWNYEAGNRPPPRAGDLSIVTDWAKQPLAVIETTQVDVMPFDQVGADFALAEGEGDATLASWRRDHEAFFGRECVRLGRTPRADMPVVCERFRVMYSLANER